MKSRRLIMIFSLLIAVITNTYAFIQSLTIGKEETTSILVWAVITMGAALVSVLVYLFNDLRADLKVIGDNVSTTSKSVSEIDLRLVKVETMCIIRHNKE